MKTIAPPPHVVLAGRHVVLEPVTDDNIAEIAGALATPETFAGGWGGGPAGTLTDPDAFTPWVCGYLPWQRGGHSYLVRLADGDQAGRCVGTTSIADFEPDKQSCHIGWTAYHHSVWGTAVNPECKLLLLGHLFDHGWGRVKLQADAVNARSRAAISKLGATFEGIARRDQRRADGSWRDAAIFSVVVDDWPRVRAGLEARLLDDRGVEAG
ncbi:GNAT family N-acetyltransferase [Aestuariimicrobium ganziense]|uniref:GNAT family N-acetyltransferase n=1 Tax=Aestuariimicrobium ganziense TaxID=2773677 RepID=UPI001941F8D4|nr:GNAT family protein [Aestuariimicrobium ganziense]